MTVPMPGAKNEAESTPASGWRAAVKVAVAAQLGRAFLWAPIALTFGIWCYFALPMEPSWTVAAPAAAAGLVLLWFRRHSGAAVLFALLLLGFGLAKFRADTVATPLLHASTAEVAVTGTVRDIATSGKRRVIILAPDQIEGMLIGDMPRRLRLSAFARQGEVQLGDRLALKVRLQPPPAPIMPGGFDYGRQLYFQGIGGTGRITAPMTVLGNAHPWQLALDSNLDAIRNAINRRINAVLTGDVAAIAEALIDGERGTIPREVNRSFQTSGLAHVLSISGLHMSLVAGGVFWVVRALLAAIPALALRFPIKKWAAGAALGAGLFYMLLAGSEVATQRSYIMIAVVFFAMLVDRPALSLRNLAVAGLVILALQPEAATEASFQMSFLAVLGLAAFFEAFARWRRRQNDDRRDQVSRVVRFLRYAGAALFTSLATTVVAGAMSSIPAAYHFGRVAPYGIIANGLAIPVISFLVMPMALAATLLMPLGLDVWPLWLMGQGLRLTIVISDWVAGLPGAQIVVHRPLPWSPMLAAFGSALLCLLAGPARLSGVPVILAGLALGLHSTMPDIVINRTGANVAVVGVDGLLVPLAGNKDHFAVEKWLLANGEHVTPAEAAKRRAWSCEKGLCVTAAGAKRLAVATDETVPPADCAPYDILVAAFPLRGACRDVPLRIDRIDLWRNGPYGLTITPGGITVATARAGQGERPWTVVPRARATRIVVP